EEVITRKRPIAGRGIAQPAKSGSAGMVADGEVPGVGGDQHEMLLATVDGCTDGSVTRLHQDSHAQRRRVEGLWVVSPVVFGRFVDFRAIGSEMKRESERIVCRFQFQLHFTPER